MAVAVTVVNYHYPTDAVGGFCTAVSVVLGLALLLERWPRGKSETEEVPESDETGGVTRPSD